MKRTVILFSFFLACILCSCGENIDTETPTYNDPPASQYELDNLMEAFESSMEYWTEDSRYSESLLCGKHWVLSRTYVETYVDGKLTETSDPTFPASSSSWDFFFNENHSMRIGDSKGVWLYVNNHIIMRHGGSYYSYEVAGLTQSSLLLREEFDVEYGDVSYYIDKSGKHSFLVREFKAAE